MLDDSTDTVQLLSDDDVFTGCVSTGTLMIVGALIVVLSSIPTVASLWAVFGIGVMATASQVPQESTVNIDTDGRRLMNNIESQ